MNKHYGIHPTTKRVADITIEKAAYLIKVGDELPQGNVTKVLPMSGFSVMQVRTDNRAKPLVLDKMQSVVVRKKF